MPLRRLALAAAILLLGSFAFVDAAHGTPNPAVVKPIPKALHLGSRGQRVKNLQWLLAGHTPSVYRGVRTYRGAIDGDYGGRTAVAVWNMKWRLGYKRSQINKVAGVQLHNYLLGKQARPLAMISIAAVRAKRLIKQRTAKTAAEKKLIGIERHELGVHEIPNGSNYDCPGPCRIRGYQLVTHALRAAWCASFQMWSLLRATGRTIADSSAGVFYIKDWAWRHGLVHAIPKPTDLVAFVDGSGHIGMVEAVLKNGFFSIEGNYDNRVAHVWHPFRSRPMVFITVPSA